MHINKKGFTLVELSIVLVIIGLLIGGILVAQSMIGTAKIQALARQIGQFDAAVANFKTKYNQLPGDNNLMGSTRGNNNSLIEGQTSGGTTGEAGKFWYDLNISGLTNPGGGTFADGSSTAGSGFMPDSIHNPKAVAGQDAYFSAYGVDYNGYRNYYIIGAGIDSGGGYSYFSPAFKAPDVLALDTKLDDGKADSGVVMGTDQSYTGSMYFDVGSLSYGLCSDNANYQVTETQNACNIRVRMGSTTGTMY